jgi:cytochrome c553
MGAKSLLLLLAVGSAVIAPGLGCTNPIEDFTVRAQGPEKSGVPEGQFHRAGQQCSACHKDGGKSKTAFILSGTIFTQPGRPIGLDQAKVQITDSGGGKYTATTNCVGNFFVKKEEFGRDLQFPILVRVVKENRSRTMGSQIGRAADCAFCHKVGLNPDDPSYFAALPQVFMYADDEAAPPKSLSCPVDPELH